MSKKEYFAYGSNLNFEQMAYRCPEATVVGTAKLDGYELAFRRGYLTILPKEGASVEGLIWSVTDHDESQLDCYEGYPTSSVVALNRCTCPTSATATKARRPRCRTFTVCSRCSQNPKRRGWRCRPSCSLPAR